jgi:hypothetical protein
VALSPKTIGPRRGRQFAIRRPTRRHRRSSVRQERSFSLFLLQSRTTPSRVPGGWIPSNLDELVDVVDPVSLACASLAWTQLTYLPIHVPAAERGDQVMDYISRCAHAHQEDGHTHPRDLGQLVETCSSTAQRKRHTSPPPSSSSDFPQIDRHTFATVHSSPELAHPLPYQKVPW